ncbi:MULTISPECIES: NAD-dependent epimerase/dehydratase family protein [unclassified Mesorhizobium]|uniref:NAD-dependent epimerase/dehydratase family protein n=1 Tax=unclassified Mesorhizobium TaxID=325217 RepID=UPI001671DB2A|nr:MULTISPECIES: NAD-dependent epimerase/dehydratase family protein [unclassified Mesorhizobium]
MILGASGFIGVNLARRLAEIGVDLTCFARGVSDYWPIGSRVILGDLVSPPPELLEAMKGAVVFHLMSSTRPTPATGEAVAEIATNLMATVGLLEATKDMDCRWVFSSSGGTVYGQTDAARITEEHPNIPISSYGTVKLAIERYFSLYHTLHGLDFVTARISNPFGPYQLAAGGQGLVAALFDRIAGGRPVEIWGDGENIRDYVYIDDVTEALILLGQRGRAGAIYNVGSGLGSTVNELVAKISTILGVRAEVVYTPSRGIDVRRNVLDINKIEHELGWRPAYTLDEGVVLTHRWWQGQHHLGGLATDNKGNLGNAL